MSPKRPSRPSNNAKMRVPGLLSFGGLILALFIALWLFPESHAGVLLLWQSVTFIGLSLIWLFFLSSLLPDRVPLITRYAWLIDGRMDARKQRYTRRVTWAWALLLGSLWLTKLQNLLPNPACSLCLPASHWNDLLGAGLIFALLTLEFQLRKRLFADQAQARLGTFVLQLLQTPFSAVWRFQPPERTQPAKRQTS